MSPKDLLKLYNEFQLMVYLSGLQFYCFGSLSQLVAFYSVRQPFSVKTP